MMDIDSMKAGREMDVLIAELLLGYRWRDYQWWDGTIKKLLWPEEMSKQPAGDDFESLTDGRIVPWWLPFYSLDQEVLVTKELRVRGWSLVLYLPSNDKPLGAAIKNSISYNARGETMAELIGRLALKVVAVEEK